MEQATRTPSGTAVTRLILQTFPLHGLLGSVGDELTKPWGLSSARWKVIGAIAHAAQPIHVAQIARNMGQTRQAVQRLVNELEQDGLLSMQDNPNHDRARLVSLTKKGRKAFDEIEDAQILWSNELTEGMSSRSIESAVRVLATLRERLENHKNRN